MRVLPGTSPEVRKAIHDRFLVVMRPTTQAFERVLENADPYRSPIQAFTWASNKGKAMQARLLQLVAMHGPDAELADKALGAAMGYAHYIHGVNPLGLVYLTNMASAGASHSAATMFHAWFAHGTRWQRVSATSPRPSSGLSGGRAQSAIQHRLVLPGATWFTSLWLLWRIDVSRCANAP